MKRKIFGILLFAALALACTFVLPTQAKADFEEYIDEENNLIFTLSDDGESYSVRAYDHSGITGTVTIPATFQGKPVTCIDYSAFSYCYDLTEIIIPDSITTIGSSAFYNCYLLREIIIPDSITSIGSSAFSNCDNLTEVTIGKGVRIIDESAFSNCGNLKAVTIPDSVASIGEGAFSGCDGLTEVTLGNNVISLGKDAFSYCDALATVTLGKKVRVIGESAFGYCLALKTLRYAGDEAQLEKIDIAAGNELLLAAEIVYNATIGEEVTPDQDEKKAADHNNGISTTVFIITVGTVAIVVGAGSCTAMYCILKKKKQ